MLKLYGFPVSNCVNMVNLALLEKGLPLDFVLAIPGQSPEFLAKSPRGKVPCLETEQGFVSEASVILEYLEESCTGKALLPTDPYHRAQVRALMKEIELYIALPARSCYGEAFFGVTLPDALKVRARDELVAGFAVLKRHGRFSPFVAGNSFALADIVFLYSSELGASVGKQFFRARPAWRLACGHGALAATGRKSERPAAGCPARCRAARLHRRHARQNAGRGLNGSCVGTREHDAP